MCTYQVVKYAFFKQRFFQLNLSLTFSWIEPRSLLYTDILLGHFLYLAYLCLALRLGLFMSYLFD